MRFIAIATLLSTLALSAAASAAFNKVMIVDVGGKSTKAVVGTQPEGEKLVLSTAKYEKGLDGAPSTAMNSENAKEILDHFHDMNEFDGIDRVLVYGTAGWRKLEKSKPDEIANIKEAIKNYYIGKASFEAAVISADTEANWAYESVKTLYPEYNTKELTFMEIGSTSAQFVYKFQSGGKVVRTEDNLGQQEYLIKLYENLGPESEDFNKCFGPHALASHSIRAHRDMVGNNKEPWKLAKAPELSEIKYSAECPELLRKHYGPGEGNKCGLNGVKMECVNRDSDVFVTSLHTFQRLFGKNDFEMSDIRNTVTTVCDGMKDGEEKARTALKSFLNLDGEKLDGMFKWIRGRPMFCADVSMHLTVLESIGVQDDQKLRHYPGLKYGEEKLPSSWVLKPLEDELAKPKVAEDEEYF